MTPAARYQAAIEVLDTYLAGDPAERALTNWARSHRFAGSKDRAAIRDHVYDVLRLRESCARAGGSMTGRGLVLGLLRVQGVDPNGVFGAGGHAPLALSKDEASTSFDASEFCPNLPDWAWERVQADHPNDAQVIAGEFGLRAPVFLRVNLAKTDRASARVALAEEGIACDDHPNVETALIVQENPRKVANSSPYLQGLVEVQDASSQASVLAIPRGEGTPPRVLDYCAGGGGKSLALAAWLGAAVDAHDVDPKRMRDIPERAARAGVKISQKSQLPKGAYDVIFVDAPCSGSGTWRRSPAAKWDIGPEDLNRLNKIQRDILQNVTAYLRPGGCLVYATCSIFSYENQNVVSHFLTRNTEYGMLQEQQTLPCDLGDGFYFASLRHKI